MTIHLTPEIENALAEEARRQGTRPELLALDCLRARFLPPPPEAHPALEQGSLADFLAGHIGVLSSSEHIPGGAHMSQNGGQKFALKLDRERLQ